MNYDWEGKTREFRERLKTELSRTDLHIGDVVTLGCEDYYWRITSITPRVYGENQIPLVLKDSVKVGDKMAPLVTAELIVELAPMVAESDNGIKMRPRMVYRDKKTERFDSSWVFVVIDENIAVWGR